MKNMDCSKIVKENKIETESKQMYQSLDFFTWANFLIHLFQIIRANLDDKNDFIGHCNKKAYCDW